MAVSPLTAQTQGNHKSNNVCACVCLCVFACACACTCLGVCVWKEEEEEEAINVFTWSECLFARVVLNKKLNHDQHKLIKPCSLEPYSSHVQKSNPQLLPLDEEMKKTPRNMLISQGWAEEKGNAHVKHASVISQSVCCEGLMVRAFKRGRVIGRNEAPLYVTRSHHDPQTLALYTLD